MTEEKLRFIKPFESKKKNHTQINRVLQSKKRIDYDIMCRFNSNESTEIGAREEEEEKNNQRKHTILFDFLKQSHNVCIRINWSIYGALEHSIRRIANDMNSHFSLLSKTNIESCVSE